MRLSIACIVAVSFLATILTTSSEMLAQERDEPLLQLLQKQTVIGFRSRDNVNTFYIHADGNQNDAIKFREEFERLNQELIEKKIDADKHHQGLADLRVRMRDRFGDPAIVFFVTSRGPDYIGVTSPGREELLIPRERIWLVSRMSK